MSSRCIGAVAFFSLALGARALGVPVIQLTKVALPPLVTAGDVATFEILVSNSGTTAATGVVVTDALPSAFSWATGTGGCFVDGPTQVLTCAFGSVPAGAAIPVFVSAPTSSSLCATYQNTATAAASNAAPATSNTVDLEVGCPSFNIRIDPDLHRGVPGEALGFRFAVRNTGHGAARGATLSDQLPGGLSWAVAPPVAGCAVDGAGLLTCSFGDIPAGAGVALHVVADSSPCGQYLSGPPSPAATNDPSPGKTSLLGVETLRPAGDVNASCGVDVADVLYLINFLFAGGESPR